MVRRGLGVDSAVVALAYGSLCLESTMYVSYEHGMHMEIYIVCYT